ncbi:DNA repair protein RecN [subsurface metagenome]
MLEELIVHNYALIDQLDIHFARGLNVLTGETGAGKSILVGALGLLLGLKAGSDSIRSGTEQVVVSGVVHVADNLEAMEWLKTHDVTAEEGYIIIRRTLKRKGKGSIFIQSSPFSLSALRELAGLLFDMHGQHEHQSLLDLENQRKLLDRHAGCEDLAADFYALYTQLLKLREQYGRLSDNEQERLRKIDLLEYSSHEIQEAKLSPGEDEALEQENKILLNHEKLSRSLNEVLNSSAESRGGGLADIRKAKSAMAEVVQIDQGLEPLSRQLDSAFYEIEDFVENIGRYQSGFEYDSSRLESLQERLAFISRLKKKYGKTVEDILAYGERCRKELEGVENLEEEKQRLEAEISAAEKVLKQKAEELSRQRHEAAARLQEKIEGELKQLGMPKVSFKVQIETKENKAGKPVYTPYGKDRVEFLISPNQGEPLGRLAQIVSGGEISRIMLAMKSVLAQLDHINALIFDEVDVGIGGEVALAVGERLKTLSSLKQVLCITHLATIAVRADNHIKVEKVTRQDRTITLAEIVSGVERREEIARMLSGDRRGEVSLRHADELLKKYRT